MKQVKHEIKLTDVSDTHFTVGSHHHILKADIAMAQHNHTVRLDAFEVEDKVHVFVGTQLVATMTPDQKKGAGLGGFSTQEIYDAVETFLASR